MKRIEKDVKVHVYNVYTTTMYIIMTTPKRNPNISRPLAPIVIVIQVSPPHKCEKKGHSPGRFLQSLVRIIDVGLWIYGSTRCIPNSLDWWENSQDTPVFHGENHGKPMVIHRFSGSPFTQLSRDKIIGLRPSDRPGTVPLLQVHHPASGILWSETTSGSAVHGKKHMEI